MTNPRPPEIELVAAFAPLVRGEDQAARLAASERLYRLIERDSESRRGPASRAQSLRRGMLAAAVLAVTVTIISLVLPSPVGGPSPAAATLSQLAIVAGAQPNEPLPTGAYEYVRAVSSSLHMDTGTATWRMLETVTLETWIARDGSGRTRRSKSSFEFLSAEDRERWEEAGSPPLTAGEDDSLYPSGALEFVDVSGLPVDVTALRASLESREILGGPPGDFATMDIIGDLLRYTYAPPELRQALFEVASGLEEAVDDGTVLDPSGRSGVGVSITQGTDRLQLIFDPATSDLLAERVFVVEDGIELPFQETTYLESGIVDSVEDRP